MPFTHGQVSTALTKKLGFGTAHSDHQTFELVVDGKVIAATKISHKARGRDIGNGLLGVMARQCNVGGKTFRGAVACTVGPEAFVAECLATLVDG